MTGQSGMSCSTRGGAVVSIIIIELNWTRGAGEQHGLGWHCMALHGICIGIAQFQSAGAR